MAFPGFPEQAPQIEGTPVALNPRWLGRREIWLRLREWCSRAGVWGRLDLRSPQDGQK